MAEADRITAAIKANDVAFNWGAMRRHNDGFKKMRDALAKYERLREIHQLSLQFRIWSRRQNTNMAHARDFANRISAKKPIENVEFSKSHRAGHWVSAPCTDTNQ